MDKQNNLLRELYVRCKLQIKMYHFLVFTIIFTFGCKDLQQKNEKNSRQNLTIDSKCYPGRIYFDPMREANKPDKRLLIHTENRDSLFQTYYKKDKYHFDIFGYWFSKFEIQLKYLLIHQVDSIQYTFFKSYIISHDTHKDSATTWNAENSIQIILVDKCDSISYVIEKPDTGYFLHLIDTLRVFNDIELLERLNYFKNIQE